MLLNAERSFHAIRFASAGEESCLASADYHCLKCRFYNILEALGMRPEAAAVNFGVGKNTIMFHHASCGKKTWLRDLNL